MQTEKTSHNDKHESLVSSKSHPSVLPNIQKYFKNFTIEPAVFLIAFSSAMDQVATSQMIALKSCKNDFAFNDSICNNLTAEENYHQNKLVTDEVSSFST